MEPDNIAQWITVVGGAIVGLWAIARKAREAQAEEVENARVASEERRAAEAAGIDQAVAGMKWLVDSLKDRIDQQDDKLDEQDRQLTAQSRQLRDQCDRLDRQGAQIDALEADQRGLTTYIDRLHDWANRTLVIVGDTLTLPSLPTLPESLKNKLSQPWNREH